MGITRTPYSADDWAGDSPAAYRARWIFPVATPPIHDGVIAVQQGLIVAIERAAVWSGPTPRDLGDVAILPGLVNAHTHLEFSELTGPIGAPGIAFPEWIRQVVAHRRARPVDQQRLSAALGLAESLRGGVTLLGEIATSGWPFELFAAEAATQTAAPLETTSPRSVVFQETIGLAVEDALEKLAAAAEHLDRFRTPHFLPGLSPHAPYTVRWDLFESMVRLAARKNAPVAMHLAESPDESVLLGTAGGPLREMLEAAGVWCDDALGGPRTILDYLRLLSASPRALVIHGNYLNAAEIEFLAANRKHMSVVYCPRTHVFFGHPPHPLPHLLAAGVNVALGTDSRASNPDLSLWEEARYLVERGLARPQTALELATRGGAAALGMASHCGTLAHGRSADFCLVGPIAAEAADPYDLLFAPPTGVINACLGSKWLAEPSDEGST